MCRTMYVIQWTDASNWPNRLAKEQTGIFFTGITAYRFQTDDIWCIIHASRKHIINRNLVKMCGSVTLWLICLSFSFFICWRNRTDIFITAISPARETWGASRDVYLFCNNFLQYFLFRNSLGIFISNIQIDICRRQLRLSLFQWNWKKKDTS